ncbi:DUF5610 domain-containing protein [Halopseudomonas salegens]|uniref:DUF5610 domain-containing protein n=1 Tax=Halopseudomonas salegens TaxID=1434072 RepID=A0A1H2FR50_9GAMM|nr:DUF5610 domain-containing protein [Halopseudomonas salegens]SDU09840.1 hypothetical protein SAMN05216210_1745 [Halopseudomonas salegens]
MSSSNPLLPAQSRYSVPATQNSPRGESLNPQLTLANRLTEQLGLAPGSLAADQADNFAPNKVADRVLGFVGGRLQQDAADGADADALQKRLDQAVRGIEKGFAEARKILDGMGMLNGKVAADIDATYEAIQSGLQNLRERFLPDTAAPVERTSQLSAERFSAQAETFEMNLTTRDGDQLRISIAQASASMGTLQAYSQSGAGGQSGAVRASSSEMRIGQWQVELDGELDADELKALEGLMQQVQELADTFYAGDVQGAFERALTLDMDTSQLASMSLSMTQTRVTQVSAAYGQVSGPGAAPSVTNNALREYADGLLQSLRQASEIGNDAREMLESMLDGGFSLDGRFDQERLDKASALNGKLLDGIQGLLDQGRLTL